MMLFARITGRLDWVCPACNVLHITYLKALRFKALHCTNCKARYEYGLTLFKAPPGPHLIPKDTLMIGGGFSLRRLVNRVFCEKCSLEMSTTIKARIQSPDESPLDEDDRQIQSPGDAGA